MRIRLLDIKGFGKFSGKRIQPSDGFNLVVGPNEAGKSTLADFVAAMLYGLPKRTRKASGSGKLYNPWNASQFAGVIEYVLDDGSVYRVDRNFEKGLTHVHDGMLRDITSNFPTSRETGPRFAEEHLGLTEPVFSRSARIQQMQTAMDPEGARMVMEKLANLSTSGSEDMSLSRALEALDNALLEKVGTGRSSIRPLDRVNARLAELEDLKAGMLEQHERYLEAWSKLKEEEERLRELRQKQDKLKLRYNAQLAGRLNTLSKECHELDRSLKEMKAALAELEEKLKESGVYSEITDGAVEALNRSWYEYQEIRRQLEECEENIKALEKEKAELDLRLQELKPAREKVDRMERLLKEQEREAAAAKDTGGKPGPAIPLFVPILFFMAAVLVLVVPALLGHDIGIPMLAAAVLSAMAGVITVLLRGMKREPIPISQADMQLALLRDEGYSGLSDYLSQKEEIRVVLSDFEACGRKVAEAEKKRAYLSDRKNTLFKALSSYLDGFGPLSDDPDMVKDAMEAFRTGLARFREDDRRAHDMRQRIESAEEKRRLILREASALAKKDITTADQLESAASAISAGCAEPVTSSDREEVPEHLIREVGDEIKNCEIRIGSLKTRLENAPSQEDLADVEDEISRLQEEKSRLELAGRSIRTAREILEEVGSRIQMNYTTRLSEEMGRLISMITNGRYQSIRSDQEGQLFLEVPECEEIMPVGRLSSGTIDQVYFSMRLAALSLIENGKETVPLFLDEPFLQYDEDRTIQAFRLLKEASAHRQVFFMTSRRREVELAREVWGDELNVIELQDTLSL